MALAVGAAFDLFLGSVSVCLFLRVGELGWLLTPAWFLYSGFVAAFCDAFGCAALVLSILGESEMFKFQIVFLYILMYVLCLCARLNRFVLLDAPSRPTHSGVGGATSRVVRCFPCSVFSGRRRTLPRPPSLSTASALSWTPARSR